MLNDDYTAYYVGDYLGSAKEVVISDTYRGLPVTEIGSFAFCDTDVRSVHLPNTITRINDCAFALCDWLPVLKGGVFIGMIHIIKLFGIM